MMIGKLDRRFFSPDDPLPPGDDAGSGTKKKVVCEFCECALSASGDVLRIGPKAKEFRSAEETIERLNKQIGKLDEEIAALKTEVETLRAAKPADVAPPARRGFLSE